MALFSYMVNFPFQIMQSIQEKSYEELSYY